MLNQQEEQLLELLNYHCPIYEDLFDKYLERLERFNMTLIEEDENKKKENGSETERVTAVSE